MKKLNVNKTRLVELNRGQTGNVNNLLSLLNCTATSEASATLQKTCTGTQLIAGCHTHP